MLRIVEVSFPLPLLQLLRCRFVLSVFYLQLLYAPATFPQRSSAAFGPISDFSLGFRPAGVAAGNDSTEIVVVSTEQPALRFFEFLATGRFAPNGALETSSVPKQILSTDLNKDGVSEFIALGSDGLTISIISKREDVRTASEYTLSGAAQKIRVGDINSDKRPDILAFGKGTAGVMTLLARPDGTFKPGQQLFQEVSISDIVTLDINGDGITDVVLLDWLANRLTVARGITRMVFSEYVSVMLPAEPGELSITPLDADRNYRLAVTLPEQKSIAIYTGNPLGDYRKVTSIQFGQRPLGVEFLQLNQDEFFDVVTSTRRGIEVAPGFSHNAFIEPTVFGIASTINGWCTVDLDQDGRRDCIAIDRSSRRLIGLANTDYAARFEWPHEYAVGMEPRGLVVADFDRNGRQDIGVVNSGSASVSLLMNRGRGRFSGQRVVSVPDRPIVVRSVAGRGDRMLITSHPHDDKVAVITLADEIFRSQAEVVPTGLEPFALFSRRDTSLVRFAVRYKSSRDQSVALSLFEQISPRQFLEQSLRPTLSAPVLALTVDELPNGAGYELLMATHYRPGKLTSVSATVFGPGLTMSPTKVLFSYPDSSGATRLIIGNPSSTPSQREILVVTGAPRNEMGIWYEKGITSVTDSLEWFRNVQPVNDDVVMFGDVSGDNVGDIVWLDGVRKGVMVSYGKEKRGYRSPSMVISADGIGGLRTASLRESGVTDLILSHTARGIVSLIFSPFVR